MYPILFTVGPIHIFSFGIFLVLSWCVFSFLFWRSLRNQAVLEHHIFDLMFFSTLVALIAARAGFVVFHWNLFAGNLLKIIALWVQPGLSFYAGLIGGIVTLLNMARSAKVRLGFILDGLAASLPWSILVGQMGSLLDGSEVGRLTTTIPWAIHYVGQVGPRHPVQVYEMIATLFVGILIIVLTRRSVREKWPYGLVGVWFFLLYSPVAFGLEFLKESSVYWHAVSANQWVLIALFAEALGAFYVRGGGREKLRPFLANIYAKLSKRHS